MHALNLSVLLLIIPFLCLFFWVRMFVYFLQDDRIPPNERFIWLLGFIFFSLFTAGYYYFTVYRNRE